MFFNKFGKNTPEGVFFLKFYLYLCSRVVKILLRN